MHLSNPVPAKHASKKIRRIFGGLLLLCGVLSFCPPAYALATPHHIYNISRRLVEVVGAPFYAIFYDGPKRIKKAWTDEVWGQEKPEKRGLLIHKVAAIPRAAGEEAKATVDGVTRSIDSGGEAVKEFISIFLGD